MLQKPVQHIRWKDKVLDTKVRTTAEMQGIHSMLKLVQLRWAGSSSKKLLFGELKVGKQSQSGQCRCHKDTLKVSLKSCGVNHNTWEDATQNRSRWRSSVKSGVEQFKAKRIESDHLKRQRRKTKASVN